MCGFTLWGCFVALLYSFTLSMYFVDLICGFGVQSELLGFKIKKTANIFAVFD